jgi:hypothetical protein
MKALGHGQIGLMMDTYPLVLPEIERAAGDEAARQLFRDRLGCTNGRTACRAVLDLVRPAGFEPAALGLEVPCSIH